MFLSDVGDRPTGHVLIRRRHAEPYSAANIKWVPEGERHSAREDLEPGISHPLYLVWRSMIGRCYATCTKQWKDYGGRGITVCDRWKNSFPAFVSDMGERPANHQLEREDNDKGYSPDNCKWATRKEQMRNRRNTARITIGGSQYLLADLAERSKLKSDTIAIRAAKGFPLEKVMENKRGDGDACKNGHVYPKKAKRTTDGARQCLICRADRNRRWRHPG